MSEILLVIPYKSRLKQKADADAALLFYSFGAFFLLHSTCRLQFGGLKASEIIDVLGLQTCGIHSGPKIQVGAALICFHAGPIEGKHHSEIS
jgi:hypothetical protein